MNKAIIVIFVILFFISILFLIFPPAEFYTQILNGKTLLTIVFFSLFISFITLIIDLLKTKYPKEHDEAHKISYTPYNKYGWYALIFFLSLPFLLFGYILLSK